MVRPSPKRKTIRPHVARIIAAVFFVLSIVLVAYDAPQLIDRKIEVLRLRKVIPFQFANLSWWHFPYRLGLDIQGGTHLVYRADMANIPSGEQSDSMEALRDVIERRINLFGVAEPVVQVEKAGGERRLIVELAGIKDINVAIRLIGETPFLEFKEERPPEEREAIVAAQKEGGRLNEDPYFVGTSLTGQHVKKATLLFNQTTTKPEIGLELTDEGGSMFAELTKRNVGKPLAIYLDGLPISTPIVNEEIKDGKAQITGTFTPNAAKELVGRLNAGALPVPITLAAQTTIGASLGETSLEKMLWAGIAGVLAVAVFMIAWYRLPGLMAVLALMLYIGIMLAIFKLIPVTLTVAGIAGFILSIGMAVDANVLIFERMKEELRRGKGLEEAVSEGFGRAWTSIRDSNVSSLITSGILYWLGASVVKGFALTLGIGIIISMISAITITRTLLFAVMMKRAERMKVLFLSGLAK